MTPNIFGKKIKVLGFEDAQLRFNDDRSRVWLNIAYVARKPTVQTELTSQVSQDCHTIASSSCDMDTGEEESKKEKMSQVSQVISYKLGKKENRVYNKEGFASEPVTPVTALQDGGFPVGPVKISCDNPVTTTGNDLLHMTLLILSE